jgi:predicted RND superfamily exporter protein
MVAGNGSLLKRLPRYVLRQRRLLVVAWLLVSIAAATQLPKLRFEDDYYGLFRSRRDEYRNLQQLGQAAGHGDCVVVLESPDVLARHSLAKVRELHTALQDLPEVARVASLHSLRRPVRVGRYLLPIFPSEASDVSDARLDKARQEARAHPAFYARFVSRDQHTTLLLVRLQEENRSFTQTHRALTEIEQVLDRLTRDSDLQFGLTGLPLFRVESQLLVQRENAKVTALAVVLATAVAWLLFRRIGHVVVVVLPAQVGILWLLGCMGFFGCSLIAINMVLPALLLVIGVTDAVHLMFHFSRLQAAGVAPALAAARMVRDLGGACFLTSLTTAIGFGSLAVCEDRMVQEFGLLAALGVGLTFVSVITLVPLLAVTPLGTGLRRNPPAQQPALGFVEHWHFGGGYFRWLARRSRSIIGIALVAVLFLGYHALSLVPDWTFLESLPAVSSVHRATRRCEQQFGGLPLLNVLVRWPAAAEPTSQELVQVLDDVHGVLEDHAYAHSPTSLLTVLHSLPGNGDELASRFPQLQQLPADALEEVVQSPARRTFVTALVPDAGAARLQAPLTQLANRLSAVARQHPSFQIDLTGFAFVTTNRSSSMIAELAWSLAIAAGVIFVVISVAYRSIAFGLCSVLPNIIPLIAVAAAMVLLKNPLRYDSVLVFSISLGIAVDDTIHFLSGVSYWRARGASWQQATQQTLEKVGPVLVTTTIIMLAGFGAVATAGIPSIRAFGTFSSLALLLALAGDVLVLPALLLATHQIPSSPIEL